MLRVGRACARLQGAPARGDRWASGRVRAHVAPPAARQLSSAVHLSTVGGLGCAATRPESVEGAAAARTRSAQLAASPGQRRSSRRHPNSREQPLPTLILTPSHSRAKNVGVDEKRAASRTHADFPCEQPQPCFKSRLPRVALAYQHPHPQTPTLSLSDSLTLASMAPIRVWVFFSQTVMPSFS